MVVGRLQAMPRNGRQYGLHVFRQNQIPAFQEGPGAGAMQQGQAGAWRQAVAPVRCLAA